jgi:hypothetical protein
LRRTEIKNRMNPIIVTINDFPFNRFHPVECQNSIAESGIVPFGVSQPKRLPSSNPCGSCFAPSEPLDDLGPRFWVVLQWTKNA